MTQPRLIDMQTAALFCGVHYDTLRKGWRAMIRDEGFPAPFRARPYKWREADLTAWQERGIEQRRIRVLRELAEAETDAANEDAPETGPSGRPSGGPAPRPACARLAGLQARALRRMGCG